MRTVPLLLLLISILHLPFSVSAQGGLNLKMDTRPEGSLLRLSRFDGEVTVPLDSIRYVDRPQVRFNLDRDHPDGVFVLEVGSLEAHRFVIAGGEMVEAVLYESGSGMAFRTVNSKENDAFRILMNISLSYSRSMDSLSRAMNSLSDFHPRHDAISDSLSASYHRVASAYNRSLDLIPDLFPTSYAAQVLVPLDKVPLSSMRPEWEATFDNDPAFNHVHFFHFVPWNDGRIITNPYLSTKVLEYLYNFTERSEDGIQYAIDRVMDHEGMHPQVEAFLVELLVDFFTEKGVSEFVAYMQERYLGNCDLPLSEEVKAKIKAAVPIAKGEPMPELSLPDGDGMQVPLSMLQADINVVVVWSSGCAHCMREMPRLKALYDHLGPRKMNVYAISLDTDREAWIRTVRDGGLNWMNVNDLMGWESPVVQQLGILGTPALFLLDAERRLLGRASSFEGLQKTVQALNEP
ncbi:MAG: TlpA family protein disulfide reductase [Flavobacteriales bacterium]|nr:TlpA family protein disulfide reductase [Flavobacteriales bacterium]